LKPESFSIALLLEFRSIMFFSPIITILV
jgi:hypothetical protein